jgi:glycosyltransferase involved in cell wall biosynthesis
MEMEVNLAAYGLAGKIKLLFGKRIVKKLEGNLLHRADAIHALSNFTKAAINKYYGVGDKITVIPHWCAEGFFRHQSKVQARDELGWPKDAKILLTACRLSAGKGVDVALKAAGPLLKARLELYFAVAGTGFMEQQLKELAQSLGIANKVCFLGQLRDRNLKKCYEAADLLLIPTQGHECFGLPVLEGLAYGLPIISTDAGALPELIEPILPQCIIPTGEVEPMRKKISDWIDGNIDLPPSQVLIDYVNRNFSRSATLEKLKTLFCK